jgi:hypothetical protein
MSSVLFSGSVRRVEASTAVNRVSQPASAGKLADRGSPPPWGVAISKLASFFPGKLTTRPFTPVSQQASAGKLTDPRSPRASGRSLLIPFSLLVILLITPASALAIGDANVSLCPNEALSGFRSYLADCRGYELVTPAFKAGAPRQPLAISGDGSRMVSEAVAVAGGVEGDDLRAYSLSTRSGSGWVTSSINPPASLLPAQEMYAASEDLNRTLWGARHNSQSIFADDLYVREEDGSLVPVGPMVSPGLTQGEPTGEYELLNHNLYPPSASRDLSHVFFQIRGEGPLWPGDTTQQTVGARSLYEYVGTNNTQPQLVGIDSEGHLLSNCGVALGSISLETTGYNQDVYNAVSRDGETVFFTAVGHGHECEESVHAPEATEVLARKGTFPVDTVSISEPSEAACEVCHTGVATFKHPVPLAEQPAEFQGASEDGSKVFFLTSQELFAGDTGQNLFEYDFNNPAGQKVLRVSTGLPEPKVLGVARVSEDGSHVYFVAEGVLTGANKEGKEPSATSQPNLYVFERDAMHPGGHLAFIGTLSGSDAADWGVVLGKSGKDERPVQATPDGRFLVFDSSADLTGGDTSLAGQVFEYDAASETLIRVSKSEAGYAEGETSANEHASTISPQAYVGVLRPSAAESFLAVSGDGSVVVFQSAGALTRGAAVASGMEAESVYEYRSNGLIGSGLVFQISDGQNVLNAEAAGVTPSGGDVFFSTFDALVSGDVDSQLDVYDARVGGGFAVTREPADCVVSKSCQGGAGAPPAFGGIGSGSASAMPGGNRSEAPPLPPPPTVKVKQRLAKALRECRGERPRHRRVACEARARKKYRVKAARAGHAKRKGQA